MYIKLKNFEPLFFREGRRFSEKDNTWAISKNVPYPSVFYGAIFSKLYVENGVIRKELARIDNPKNIINSKNKNNFDYNLYKKEIEKIEKKYLTISNIYIYDYKNDEIYLKAPLDLFIDSKYNKVHMGKFKDIDCISNALPSDLKSIKCILHSPNIEYENERVDNYYMKLSDLLYYYVENTSIKNINLYKENELFTYSRRTGIEIERGQTKEGALYNLEMSIFKDDNFCFLLDVQIGNRDDNDKIDKIKFKNKGVLKLGGENRTCAYEAVKKTPRDINKLINYEEKSLENISRVKVITTTPLIIAKSTKENEVKVKKNIWYPDITDINVVGASTANPMHIGGYDMKITDHKYMYKGLEAGTVYLLDISKLNGDISNLKELRTKIEESMNENIKNESKGIENYKGFNKFIIVPGGEK